MNMAEKKYLLQRIEEISVAQRRKIYDTPDSEICNKVDELISKANLAVNINAVRIKLKNSFCRTNTYISDVDLVGGLGELTTAVHELVKGANHNALDREQVLQAAVRDAKDQVMLGDSTTALQILKDLASKTF